MFEWKKDYTFKVTFYMTSKKQQGEILLLLEAYINEVCSNLENNGIELTYDIKDK